MNRVGVPRRRLFVWALLIGAVAGVGLTLWQMRQGSLDAALLTAIREDDTHAAIALLDQGANANATYRIGRAESLDLLFRDLQDWLHGQRPPQRSYFAPALYLAFMHEPGVGPSRVSEALSGLRLPHRPFSGTARTFDPARQRLERVDLIAALLNHGADPNCYPGAGPLHFAVRLRHHDVVRLLLEHGANPNAGNGITSALPLEFADRVSTELLIQHGASVNLRGRFGQTPLMSAVMAGATDWTSSDGPDHLDLLLRHGAEVNAHDQYGQTVLMHAASVSSARILLDHGAEVNARDRNGASALMMACAGGRDPGMPSLLIQRGARASAVDNAGRRARDYATNYAWGADRTDLCRFLDAAEAAERQSGARIRN